MRVLETQKAINDAISLSPGLGSVGMFAASRGLHHAIWEYHAWGSHERTFNALRDAIRRAEAEIDKYHKMTEEKR